MSIARRSAKKRVSLPIVLNSKISSRTEQKISDAMMTVPVIRSAVMILEEIFFL